MILLSSKIHFNIVEVSSNDFPETIAYPNVCLLGHFCYNFTVGYLQKPYLFVYRLKVEVVTWTCTDVYSLFSIVQ